MRTRTRSALGALLRGVSLLGLLLGAGACVREERHEAPATFGEKVDEAVEELRDETMDAQEELEDEIDDHT
jgi:hypothetical protein